MAGMGSSREGLLAGAGVGFHGLEEAWTAQEEGVMRRRGGAAGTQKYQEGHGRWLGKGEEQPPGGGERVNRTTLSCPQTCLFSCHPHFSTIEDLLVILDFSKIYCFSFQNASPNRSIVSASTALLYHPSAHSTGL